MRKISVSTERQADKRKGCARLFDLKPDRPSLRLSPLRSSIRLRIDLADHAIEAQERSHRRSAGRGAGRRDTLWCRHPRLDPQNDYVPLRLQQKKCGGDLMDGTPMSALKGEENRQSLPAEPMRGLVFQVDFRSAVVGGKGVIIGHTQEDRLIYEGGGKVLRRTETMLKNIRFDPKPAELERTTPIPEGTRVSVRGSTTTHARWKGGKVVVDPVALPRIP